MNRLFYLVLIALAWVSVWAQSPAKAQAQKGPVPKAKDSSMVLDTVNLLGEDAYSPFIWNQDDGALDSMQIREQIEKRDFAHEEFFMRNIDREEFEEERALLQFLGQEGQGSRRKKTVWTPFPDPSKSSGPAPSSTPSPAPSPELSAPTPRP